MKDFLQGKWLKHPLHPILVHLPTSLWPAALVFDLLEWSTGRPATFVITSFYCILIGLLAALLAIPTGLADYSDIRPEKPAKKIGLYHMILNLMVSSIFLTNFLLRWLASGNTFDHDYTLELSHLALSALGVLLLVVSGYLGGKMVYDYGIGIGRASKKKWRKIAEEGKARVPSEKGGEA